ncbi:MAG: Wzz/FepE/Etk N-terminal domain-containing protein, partial [Desulfosalsimonadaceae bacterium]|nr:Wzz/FepE/Etk N-terminal domain-containing protein [Desulfosalsimonadaceae bacterium]
MNTSHDMHRQQTVESAIPFEDSDGPDLRDLLRKLNRRKTVIFGVFVLVMAITLLYLSRQVPQYTATARLMFETRKNQIVDVGAMLTGLPDSPSGMGMVINSEMEIIRSEPFLGRVSDKLRLEQSPQFNPDLQPVPKIGIFD